jgi:hypothetical protein
VPAGQLSVTLLAGGASSRRSHPRNMRENTLRHRRCRGMPPAYQPAHLPTPEASAS